MDITSQIPNLVFVHSEPGDSEPTEMNGRYIAKSFHTLFKIKDRTKTWNISFEVRVSDLGTPKLQAVSVTGNRLSHPLPNPSKSFTKENSAELLEIVSGKKRMFPEEEIEEYLRLMPESESVERWQLKFVEQYRSMLFELAIENALKLGKPEIERFPNGTHRIHWLPIAPLEGKELKKLQAEISKTIRQKITPDFIKQVADIYLDAIKRGLDPNPEIMARFKCKKRTAQEWTQKAREMGYPLPANVGRIPRKKPINRKEK